MNNQLENLPKHGDEVNSVFIAVAITFFISFISMIIYFADGKF